MSSDAAMSRMRARGSSAMHRSASPWLERNENGIADRFPGNDDARTPNDDFKHRTNRSAMLSLIYAFGDHAFSVASMNHDGAATLMLSGELDVAGERTFCAALDKAEAGNPSTVVFDLRGLNFIDVTGLRLLIHAHRRSHRSGRRMVLVRGKPQVRRILTVSGIADRIESVDAPEQAG